MRLVTRPDFDGLACAVLLEELGIVDEYEFMHPKDIQDGKVELTQNDVLANVPYCPGCGLWFDHHSTELERLKLNKQTGYGSLTRAIRGFARLAPSCARVIYDYYNGSKELTKFDKSGLMWAVDKFDPADFEIEEILKPEGWILLAFLVDVRTGLGRCEDFRIDNLQLMIDMIKYLRTMQIDEIMELPDIKERSQKYFEYEKQYKAAVQKHSKADKNVLIINYKDIDDIVIGNRFIEYALFPEQNVSVKAIWGLNKQNVVLSVGHSILNRTCKSNIGALMYKYGGGGHYKVGTCQISTDKADTVMNEIIEYLKEKG